MFQGSLLVILIMIDGNEKRHCGGGFRVILKSTVRKCIEINLENLWILGLKGLKPHWKTGFPPLRNYSRFKGKRKQCSDGNKSNSEEEGEKNFQA